MNRSEVRYRAEITKAHDVITAVLRGEVKVDLEHHERRILQAALDTLCWVLLHPHNDRFEQGLQALLTAMQEAGYELQRVQ